ncbi:MAG: ATP-dependent DNA ligase [Ekhidna sp.]|nr:ATP-dependent DNA ligase [Ekhidna sp.]
MKHFVDLFESLDQTTKTNERVSSLVHYLDKVNDQDKLWTIALLSGKRPKRAVNSSHMKEWAAEIAGIPMSLFEETYHVVGDMAETISLLISNDQSLIEKSLSEWMGEVIALKGESDEVKKTFVTNVWKKVNRRERFVFNKLIGGSFRVGVSQKTMVKALAKYTEIEESELAHRLMGNWTPETHSYDELILTRTGTEDHSKPYPFFLAYPLDETSDFTANPKVWIAERKWDGIRGQLIKRNDEIYIWTRGEELVTDKYPELLQFDLPNGVALDGEILAYKNGKPLGFNDLQKRIGRKTVAKKLLQDIPVVFLSYDLMEMDGNDIRQDALVSRRDRLKKLVEEVNHQSLLFSEEVAFQNEEDISSERENARHYQTEGLMIKRRDSTYQVGRKRGDWWKWKVEPLVIDAVLIYAMRGHGRRANLFTDYTFAVWNEGELVPFTKAYSGLTDQEFRQVDRFVRNNLIEKFGPVRSVKPELVFEIAFEGIAESSRHKSGIALRFPRMSRWRKDKVPEEANSLSDLKSLLKSYG